MRVKAFLGGVAALVLALVPAAALGTPGQPAHQQPSAAPLYGADRADAIAGRYIVVYRNGFRSAPLAGPEQVAVANGAQVQYRYGAALQGFAATMSDAALNAVRADANVAYVEADSTVSTITTQTPATWGLDRIDQRTLPLNNTYSYDTTGSGVTAYIIDTGIRISHTEFPGRARSGFDAVDGLPADDCNGHGTHVSGTVGGATYGVAKAVALVAVRVLDCSGSGSTSGVIAGVNWVTSDHAAGTPAVANMSLGGGVSTSLDSAVANSVADGVTYAIAAGNSNADACNSSPARVATAITVGATTSTDARASFSNFGTCLDIFAPGQSITSSWNTSDTATNTISGTSMATPHVAGAAARYLQSNPSASPATVTSALAAAATPNVVGNPGAGSPNRLLYVAPPGGTPPTTTTTPPPTTTTTTTPPSGCGSYANVYTGTLSGTGDADIQPNGTWYFSAAGTHQGCLAGPAGVDFDLYLQRWNGFGWTTVASGTSPDPGETVSFTGSSGYYRWRVLSYRGAGSYTFGLNRP